MNYSLRKDVVLEKTDGVYVLIALRSAWKECPFAMPTIPIYADIWNQLKKGVGENSILQYLMDSRNFTYEKSKKVYDKFIEAASKYHYLVYDNDEASVE